MCADNAPSACIMRGCVFCADYAQMRIVRMCSCAVLRSVCICAACASAHVRCCAVCAEAETLAGRPQMHHFPSYSRAGGRIHQRARIIEHPRRKLLLNDIRKAYHCHTFQSDAARFARQRASKVPPMRNAVTLVVLEHVRTCKFPIPAVCVDVKDPPKNRP